MRALMHVKEAELMGMPKLKRCVLMGGLKNVKSVKMENAGKLESVKELKEVVEEEERKKREEEERKKREEEERKRREEEERKRREEMMALAKSTVSVKCVGDLKNASCYVGVIVIASNCCNDSELNVLDLSRFVNLRELNVGDECFEYVKEVKQITLGQLESVVIGKMCFANNDDYDDDSDDDDDDDDLSRRFYLKNCERVRELKIGCYSFSDYTVCEIENVPSLEVIEMGELNEDSWSFHTASLELKSDCERMK